MDDKPDNINKNVKKKISLNAWNINKKVILLEKLIKDLEKDTTDIKYS